MELIKYGQSLCQLEVGTMPGKQQTKVKLIFYKSIPRKKMESAGLLYLTTGYFLNVIAMPTQSENTEPCTEMDLTGVKCPVNFAKIVVKLSKM